MKEISGRMDEVDEGLWGFSFSTIKDRDEAVAICGFYVRESGSCAQVRKQRLFEEMKEQ